MRNISFAVTKDQIKSRTKTVTRRTGWRTLRPGELLQGVEKGQGLKKGESVVRLSVIRVTDVRIERLRRMMDELDYGFLECQKEGFGEHTVERWPSGFVEMFCAMNKCTPDTEVTRIEFEYV